MIPGIQNVRWKWFAVSAGGLIVLAAGFAVYKVNAALKKAEPALTDAIQRALPGHALRLKELSYRFPLGAAASNLELSNRGGFDNGTLMKADSVNVQFKLLPLVKVIPALLRDGSLDAARGAPGTSNVGAITVTNPSLLLSRKENQWNLPQREGGGSGAFAPVELIIAGGALQVQDDRGTLDGLAVKDVNGSISLNPADPKADIELRGNASESIKIAGRLTQPQNFHVEAEVRGFGALDWARKAGALPSKFQTQGDQLDADLSIDFALPSDMRRLEDWRWDGTAKILEHRAAVAIGSEQIAVKGTAEIGLRQFDLAIKNAEYRSAASLIKVSGEIRSLNAQPVSNLQAEMTLEGGELKGLFPAHLKPQGPLAIHASVIGTLSAAHYSGTVLASAAQLGGRALSLNASVFIASDTLALESFSGVWGESSATAKGQFSRSLWDGAATIKNLPLEYFYPKESPGISGKATVQIKAKGSGARPVLTGQASIKNSVFFNNKIGFLSGSVKIAGNTGLFRMATPDSRNRVVLEVERREPDVILRQLQIVLDNGQSVKASGRLQSATRTIAGELSVDSLLFSTLRDKLKLLAPFDGKISANGKFSGTWEDPALDGTLRANGIFFSDRGVQQEPVENFSSRFSWNKNQLTLPGFSIGQTYSGNITVTQKPQKGFSVDATAKNANPKILFALLNLHPDITGSLNGAVKLSHLSGDGISGPAHRFQGDGSLKIEKGRWSQMAFDAFTCKFQFEPNELKVTEFKMKQAGGFLDLTGVSGQNEVSNALKIQGAMQNFIVAKSRLDGPAALNGRLILEEKFRVSGELASDDFKLNRIRVGKTRADLEWRERLLTLGGIRLGRFIEGDITVAMSEAKKESPSLSGRWRSKPLPAEDWFELVQLSTPPIQGEMSVSGSIGGTIKNPEYTLATDFFNLKIVLPKNREIESSLEGLNGSGRAVFKDNLLKSLSATLTRGANERLTVLGQADLGSRTMNLQASIHQINANILFQPMGLKKFQGPMDGTLSIDGDWSNPVIRGDVRGLGGMLGDIAMESWDVAGTFKEKEFSFTRFNARGSRGGWRFSVLEDSWIRPQNDNKSGIYRLNTNFANISVGPVFFVGSGILEGNWNTDAGSGLPIFTGYAKVNECSANGFEITPTKLTLQYHDKTLRFLKRQTSETAQAAKSAEPEVTGALDFTKLPCVIFRQFSVDGAERRIFFMDGELCSDQPAFKIEGSGVDASLLTGIFGSPVPVSGQSEFKIEGKKTGGATIVEGSIALSNGKMFDVPLESLDSKFNWKNGVFNLDTFEAKSRQYFNLSGSGRFPLPWGKVKPSDLRMDLSLKCTNGNLAFLNFMESDLVRNAKGAFSTQLSIKGTSSNPVVNGSIKVTEGEAGSKYLGRSLQKADIAIQIKSNKITVQKAEGEVGGQKVEISGDTALTFDSGEMALDHFNLRLKTIGSEGIAIQIPDLPAVQERLGLPSAPSKGSVIASITLAGRTERPRIGGDIILNDVLFSYPPPKKTRDHRYWFDGAEWDITLKSGKRTMFQNDVAYAKLDGQLKFNGTKEDLIAKGKLTSNEGSIAFLGAKFDLVQASLELQPPAKYTLGQSSVTVAETHNVAYLSLRAEQRKQVVINGQEVQDVITMQIDRTPLSDKFDSKSITFRSSARPNLDSERVISSAAGFETDFQNLTPEQKDLQMRQGMARILDTQLASPLAKSILQTIGIADRIEIIQDETYGKDGRKSRSSDVRGEETSALDPLIGQTFLVEKTFASRLGVGYRATFDKIQDRADFIHQLQLRYPFYKGVYFIGSTELDSEENLGRQRERYGGIETRVRWDFSDLYNWARKKKPETLQEK